MKRNNDYLTPERIEYLEEIFQDVPYMKKLTSLTRNSWLSVLFAMLLGYISLFFYVLSTPHHLFLRIIFYIMAVYCLFWFFRNLRISPILSIIEVGLLFAVGQYMSGEIIHRGIIGWWDNLLAAMMLISENDFFALWRNSKKNYKEIKQYFDNRNSYNGIEYQAADIAYEKIKYKIINDNNRGNHVYRDKVIYHGRLFFIYTGNAYINALPSLEMISLDGKEKESFDIFSHSTYYDVMCHPTYVDEIDKFEVINDKITIIISHHHPQNRPGENTLPAFTHRITVYEVNNSFEIDFN